MKTSQATSERTLLEFSEGRISRHRVMFLLDVDYSELWDLMAAHDIALPELTDAAAAAEGRKMVAFLATKLYSCGREA